MTSVAEQLFCFAVQGRRLALDHARVCELRRPDALAPWTEAAPDPGGGWWRHARDGLAILQLAPRFGAPALRPREGVVVVARFGEAQIGLWVDSVEGGCLLPEPFEPQASSMMGCGLEAALPGGVVGLLDLPSLLAGGWGQ